MSVVAGPCDGSYGVRLALLLTQAMQFFRTFIMPASLDLQIRLTLGKLRSVSEVGRR
jgi:hypothetical protein